MHQRETDHNGERGLALPVAPPINLEPLPRHPGEPGHWVGKCRDGVLAVVEIQTSWDLPEAAGGGRVYKMSFRRDDESHGRGGFYTWDDTALRPLRDWDPIHPWPRPPLRWPQL